MTETTIKRSEAATIFESIYDLHLEVFDEGIYNLYQWDGLPGRVEFRVKQEFTAKDPVTGEEMLTLHQLLPVAYKIGKKSGEKKAKEDVSKIMDEINEFLNTVSKQLKSTGKAWKWVAVINAIVLLSFAALLFLG